MAAPVNTNVTATFELEFGGVGGFFTATEFTVPVKLLEEPFLEVEDGPHCLDESVEITVDRNHLGPQNVCGIPFTGLIPPGQLVWTSGSPNIKIEGAPFFTSYIRLYSKIT